MTINSTAAASGPFIGTGAPQTLPFDFHAASIDEVRVEVNGAAVTGFTVVLEDDGTGSVVGTFAAGGVIYIESDPSFIQDTSFARFAPYFPDSLNPPLDRAAIRDIALKGKVDRSLIAPIGADDPVQYFRDIGFKGADSTVPGPANSTYDAPATVTQQAQTTNQSAIVADPSQGGTFAYKTGNFTTQIANDPYRGVYIPAQGDPTGVNGAWVRIGVGKLNAQWFGAKGDGTNDDAAAINAALAFAGKLTIADTPFPGSGYVVKGGATVELPPGKFRTTSTLLLPQNVSLEGAKDRSTAIASTATNHVLRNIATATVQGTYDKAGMAIKNLDIIGDRTVTNQVGIGLLRPYEMLISGVHVTGCGSDGMELRQALRCTIGDFRATRNGGKGLRVGAGASDWGQPSNDLPSNANTFYSLHLSQNDAAGLHLDMGSNGNVFVNPTLEYNYYSTQGASGSCQVLSETDGYTANVLVDPWLEGPCEAQVRVNHNAITTAIDLVRPAFFSGENGNVMRALIVQGGRVNVIAPRAPAAQFPTINGSRSPFRFTDKTKCFIYVENPLGANTAAIDWVEYLDGSKDGIQLNYALNDAAYTYGLKRHYYDGGQVATDQWYRMGDGNPYVQVESFDGALGFGPGGGSPIDVRLKRTGARTLGLDNRGYTGGSFFDLGGDWNGNHPVYTRVDPSDSTQTIQIHEWYDATGKKRTKIGAPTSDTDGTIVGVQTA